MVQVTDRDYQGHEVFENLAAYGGFYGSLSMSVLQFPTVGTTALANIDTYVFSSIQSTLESISYLLEKGRLNDAFALLRKFHDAATINVYVNLWLDDHRSTDTYSVPLINDWLHGKSTEFPGVKKMNQYIEKSLKLGQIAALIKSDERYEQLRLRCNDHMHLNFFQTILLNDGAVYLKNRLAWLNTFSEDLNRIIIYHLTLIFSVREIYMMSSDYIDYLDVGQTPPDGCEKWVNPLVQAMLSKLLLTARPDLYAVLKEGSAMELD